MHWAIKIWHKNMSNEFLILFIYLFSFILYDITYINIIFIYGYIHTKRLYLRKHDI